MPRSPARWSCLKDRLRDRPRRGQRPALVADEGAAHEVPARGVEAAVRLKARRRRPRPAKFQQFLGEAAHRQRVVASVEEQADEAASLPQHLLPISRRIAEW